MLTVTETFCTFARPFWLPGSHLSNGIYCRVCLTVAKFLTGWRYFSDARNTSHYFILVGGFSQELVWIRRKTKWEMIISTFLYLSPVLRESHCNLVFILCFWNIGLSVRLNSSIEFQYIWQQVAHLDSGNWPTYFKASGFLQATHFRMRVIFAAW